MLAIGVLIASLIPHEGFGLHIANQNNPVSDASDLGQRLLRMVRDSSKNISSLKVSGGATTFVAGIGKITAIVVDTRMPDPYPYQGTPNTWAANPGAKQKWVGWQTKNCLFRSELEKLAVTDPNQYAVLTDGGDMIFGGCSEDEFLDAYFKTARASGGASIVFGAELGLYPNTSAYYQNMYDEMEGRRRDVLLEMHLPEDLYADYVDCTFSEGPCSDPPRYKYVNGGFRAGPVRDLLALQTILCNETGDEQLKLANLLFQFPRQYTLDYSGPLVMNLHNFGEGALRVLRREQRPLAHLLHNSAVGQTQCFIHGNGKTGKNTMDSILREQQ